MQQSAGGDRRNASCPRPRSFRCLLSLSPPPRPLFARRAAPCVKLPGRVEPMRRTSGGQADGLLPERLPPQCEKMRPADEIYFSRQMGVICSAGNLSVTCAAARIPPRWKLRAFHNLLIRVLDDQKRLSSVPGCCIIYHYIFIYIYIFQKSVWTLVSLCVMRLT